MIMNGKNCHLIKKFNIKYITKLSKILFFNVFFKAWKARMTGYEECVKLFRTQNSDQSPEFNKYLSLIKKFVLDPNENAREKALDAVFAFVEEAQVAGK